MNVEAQGHALDDMIRGVLEKAATASDDGISDLVTELKLKLIKFTVKVMNTPFLGWEYNEKLGRNVNMVFECGCDSPNFNVTHHRNGQDGYMLTTCCKKRIEYK